MVGQNGSSGFSVEGLLGFGEGGLKLMIQFVEFSLAI